MSPSGEHTPINLPTKNISFQQEHDATVAASEDLNFPRHSGTSQDFQNKVNSFSEAREFYDPETGSSSGATHVPSQPSTIPSPRTMPCRDSGLLHDARNIVGTSRSVFEQLPAGEGRTSTLFDNSKNLASPSHGVRPDIPGNTKRPERELRREPQDSSMPVPRFQKGGGLLNHTGGTCSHSGMMD